MRGRTTRSDNSMVPMFYKLLCELSSLLLQEKSRFGIVFTELTLACKNVIRCKYPHYNREDNRA